MHSDLVLLACMTGAFAIGIAWGILIEFYDGPMRRLETRRPDWF